MENLFDVDMKKNWLEYPNKYRKTQGIAEVLIIWHITKYHNI